MMRRILRVHEYISPSARLTGRRVGQPVMRHLRMEQLAPEDSKFLYQHWNPRAWTGSGDAADRPVPGSAGWVWGKPAWADSLLYGLENLQRFRTTADTVSWTLALTEGERDADTLNARNLARVVAVSHHGGAGKFGPEQAERLRGWLGRVVVVRDIDPAGAECALGRYRAMRRIGIPTARLSIRRPAGKLVRGRDLTDHLTDGYGFTELVIDDVQTLAAKVARLSPAQRMEGSRWADPVKGMLRCGEITAEEAAEMASTDLRSWRPRVQAPADRRGGGSSPSGRRAARRKASR